MAYYTFYNERERYNADLNGLTAKELNDIINMVVEKQNHRIAIYVRYQKKHRHAKFESVGSSLLGGLGSHHFKEEEGAIYVTRGNGVYYPLVSAYLEYSIGTYSRKSCEPGQNGPDHYVDPKWISVEKIKAMI